MARCKEKWNILKKKRLKKDLKKGKTKMQAYKQILFPL